MSNIFSEGGNLRVIVDGRPYILTIGPFTLTPLVDKDPPVVTKPLDNPKPSMPTGTVATRKSGTYITHYQSIQQVPWESLLPGDVVEIRPGTYRDKWLLRSSGTLDKPITIVGVLDSDGNAPVFTALDAKTRAQILEMSGGMVPDAPPGYDNPGRGILQIDGEHICIKNLRFTGARARVPYFTSNGKIDTYDYNAAGIFVKYADDLLVEECELDNCGNGMFIASAKNKPSGKIRLRNNFLHDNSYPGDGDQYHNLYAECREMVLESNLFLPPAGPNANNIKDRSGSTTITENLVVGGNRQIDLVESANPEFTGAARVSNNLLIDLKDYGNHQIVHFGRDMRQDGKFLFQSRNGLSFRNNQLISPNNDAVAIYIPENVSGEVINNVLFCDLTPTDWGGMFFRGPLGTTLVMRDNVTRSFARASTEVTVPINNFGRFQSRVTDYLKSIQTKGSES